MFTWSFWRLALERATKATIYGLTVATTGTYILPGHTGWQGIIYTGTAMGLASLAGSAMSTRIGNPNDPTALPPLPPPPTNGPPTPPASPLPPAHPGP